MLASYGANLVNITLEITTNILIDEEAYAGNVSFFLLIFLNSHCDRKYFFVFFFFISIIVFLCSQNVTQLYFLFPFKFHTVTYR